MTIEKVVAVARDDARVELASTALERVRRSRAVVEALAADSAPHYGASTGFGALATGHIPVERRRALHISLVRSHAVGSGPEVEREVVRAMVLLRAATMATGHTGVGEQTLLAYWAMLDAGITPVVHEYGSLGCSGDLAPLAHCALVLVGEGEVRDAAGDLRPAGEALASTCARPGVGGCPPVGTDRMLGMLCLALHDLRELVVVVDIAAAMSIKGLLGTDDVVALEPVALRPRPGVPSSVANLRIMLRNNGIRESHRSPARTRIQEDHVSRGWAAGRKLRRSLDGLARDRGGRGPTRCGRRPRRIGTSHRRSRRCAGWTSTGRCAAEFVVGPLA
ncbi:MAG: aromatic amino acid lyase [Phycicoccus sp.]